MEGRLGADSGNALKERQLIRLRAFRLALESLFEEFFLTPETLDAALERLNHVWMHLARSGVRRLLRRVRSLSRA